MAKQVLRSLDVTTLLVALDHLEEHGPPVAVPDPYESPAECVYLKYIGDAHIEALAARLPHVRVRQKVPSNLGYEIRKVFSKAAILHVLNFAFPNAEDFAPFVRDLKSYSEQSWRVLGADGKPIKRPKKDKSEGGSR